MASWRAGGPAATGPLERLAGSAGRQAMRATLGRRLPHVDGVTTVRGLRRPIRIRRDRWHVPHIDAETTPDAWYGLGFCQGQDRAFQIELFARVAAGRLAETLGSEQVPTDRLARRLGFQRRAGQQLHRLSAEARDALLAFAAGVSAGSTTGSPQPAHEFALLRTDPAPVAAVDILAILWLQTFLLAGNWEMELARLQVLVHDGPAALMALSPVPRDQLAGQADAGSLAAAADALSDDVARLRASTALTGASNNWAVAAARTATGRPLLANDPHLAPMLPPLWYLAHLRTPTWAVAGAALAGTPGLAAGHNGHGAWGITAGLADVCDLFVEQVTRPGHVRDTDGEVACTVRREVIDVRGGESVIEETLETPRGPIVTPVLEAPVALSLAGPWLDPGPIDGMLTLGEARSFDDARKRFREWPGMSLNLVWADAHGTIGWQLVGDVPVRRRGRPPLVPQPGADPGSAWTGQALGIDQLPHDVDPARGYLATANDRPPGDDPALGADFLEGYRAAAIREALDARDDWGVADTLALQVDTRSLAWRDLREALMTAPADQPDTALAQQLLAAWDGMVAIDSPAAAVYEVTIALLQQRVVMAKAPLAGAWLLGRSGHPLRPYSVLAVVGISRLVTLLRSQPGGWFPESWPQVVARALADAVATLRARAGDDPARWGWGHLRRVTLRHPVSQGAPALAAVFDRGPFPWPGDSTTIPQASSPPADPLGDPVGVASLRMVIDVGAWEHCRWVLPGGQSGNPFSPHYDDQLPLFLQASGLPIAWTEAEVEAAAVTDLRLIPASA